MAGIRPGVYIAVVFGVAVMGIALATAIQLSNPFTKGASTQAALERPPVGPLTDGASKPSPLPGRGPMHNWRLLATSAVDQGVRLNVEKVLAIPQSIHVFYSIVPDVGLRDRELIPQSFEVRDDLGREFPVEALTSFGNVAGASLGVLSLGPYEPGSRTFELSVSELGEPGDTAQSVSVKGDWRISFLERLQPEIMQYGSTGLYAPTDEGSVGGVMVKVQSDNSVHGGSGWHTERFAVSEAETGATSFVHVEIRGKQVTSISLEKYDQIFQTAVDGADAMRAEQMERARHLGLLP